MRFLQNSEKRLFLNDEKIKISKNKYLLYFIFILTGEKMSFDGIFYNIPSLTRCSTFFIID
jgi:hypothetical protein